MLKVDYYMMIESLIISYLYFLGLTVCVNIEDSKLRLLIAFPISLVIWGWYYFFARSTFLIENYITYSNIENIVNFFFGASLLFIVVWMLYSKDRNALNNNLLTSFWFFILVKILLLLKLPVIMSGDSFEMVDIFSNYESMIIYKRSIFLNLIQSLSVYINEDYILSTYIYLISINFYLLVGYFVFYMIEKLNIIQSNKYAISILVPILLLSSFMGFYNFFYVNHHMLVAIILLISAFLIYKYLDEPRISYLVYMTILIVGTILMRVESAILSFIFLVIFLSNPNIIKRYFHSILFTYVTICSIYLLWVIGFMPDDAEIKPILYQVIILIMWVVTLSLYFADKTGWEFDKTFFVSLHKITLLLSVILLLLLIFIKPINMLWGARNVVIHLIYERSGAWGLLWYFVFGAVAYVYKRNKSNLTTKYNVLIFYFLISYIFMQILMFFRNPYTTYFGDSANRMLFHIVPFILIWSVYIVCSNLSRSKKQKNYHLP